MIAVPTIGWFGGLRFGAKYWVRVGGPKDRDQIPRPDNFLDISLNSPISFYFLFPWGFANTFFIWSTSAQSKGLLIQYRNSDSTSILKNIFELIIFLKRSGKLFQIFLYTKIMAGQKDIYGINFRNMINSS